MTQHKSIEARAQEWLKANGHDLTNTNEIHAAEMRAYARQQVIAEEASPKAATKQEQVAAEVPISRPMAKAKK